MSVDTSAVNDRSDWEELSREEQSEIMREGLSKAHGNEPGVDNIPRWEEMDNVTQEDTLAALQGALDETWVALGFEDNDEKRTIPFEMYTLTESDQDEVKQWGEVFAELEQSDVETVDELEGAVEEGSELYGMISDFDPWLNDYLGKLTVGDRFTAEWWSDGDQIPGELKVNLFLKITERFQSQDENTQSFR